jgi:MFS family permease
MSDESAGDRRLMIVAVLASFVAFLDGSVVTLALPAIGADFGGGLRLQQWVFDGYLLLLGALILLAGAVSDSIGRPRRSGAGPVGRGRRSSSGRCSAVSWSTPWVGAGSSRSTCCRWR